MKINIIEPKIDYLAIACKNVGLKYCTNSNGYIEFWEAGNYWKFFNLSKYVASWVSEDVNVYNEKAFIKMKKLIEELERITDKDCPFGLNWYK